MLLNVIVEYKVEELAQAEKIVDDITSYAYGEIGLEAKELNLIMARNCK